MLEMYIQVVIRCSTISISDLISDAVFSKANFKTRKSLVPEFHKFCIEDLIKKKMTLY